MGFGGMYGSLSDTPISKGYKHFASEHEMVKAFAEQSAPDGRHRKSRMGFTGEQFLSYRTTIARFIGKGKTRCCVVDSNNFGSTITPGHRRDVERALQRAHVKVFHVDFGGRGQDLRITPEQLRDYHVDSWMDAPKPQKGTRAALIAREYLHRYLHLPEALEVCKWFKLPSARIEKIIAGEEANRQRNTEILEAYEAKINASTDARRAREREEAERQRLADIKQAIERAEAIKEWADSNTWKLADIPEPMKTGLHSFGYDDGLLAGRTDLLAVVLKIRLKVEKKESDSKISELWRENWDLEKKANKLDAIQERMKPVQITGDRAIVLE
tara:strand:+ start:9792 stop:10775 length:984 start_codon:yes stop_codon:yes gene_type:complete